MLSDEVLKVYLKRWGIECFFKDIKQHFGYSQCKSSKYSTLIGDLTIRYVFYILFTYHKESSSRMLESELKSTQQVLLEFYQEMCEIWLSDFIEIMFRKQIKAFLKKAIELGYSDIKELINNLDSVLDDFFRKEIHIDKIEEYDKCA